jgi:cupin fold WbuC family metalloprotein
MRYKVQNSEVLYSKESITIATRADIDLLKQLSANNPRKRIRLCSHKDPDDCLHEMLIVHGLDAYVRPHRHPGKTESMHVIEGLVDVVLFTEDGEVDRVISMGDYAAGKTFYYRMSDTILHSLIIRSEVLVFHEITNGPFNRSDTIYASWSPDGSNVGEVNAYVTALNERVRLMQSTL